MLQTLDDVPITRSKKAGIASCSHEHVFIDGCVQIWPDADYAKLKDCGVTAYCVTTFRPHHGAENALDALADWWRVAKTYPEIRIALTAQDILAAKKQGQAALVLASQGGDFLGQNLNRLEIFHGSACG